MTTLSSIAATWRSVGSTSGSGSAPVISRVGGGVPSAGVAQEGIRRPKMVFCKTEAGTIARIRTLGGLPSCLANKAHRFASTAAKVTTSFKEVKVASSAGDASKDAIAPQRPTHLILLGAKWEVPHRRPGRADQLRLGHRPRLPKHKPQTQPHTQQTTRRPHRTHRGSTPAGERCWGSNSVPIKSPHGHLSSSHPLQVQAAHRQLEPKWHVGTTRSNPHREVVWQTSHPKPCNFTRHVLTYILYFKKMVIFHGYVK